MGAGPPLTDLLYRHLEETPQSPQFENLRRKVTALTDRYQFFHWHVAFLDVFQVPEELSSADPRVDTGVYNEGAGWNGGFDVVLGNPPWERIKIQEKEWFAQRNPEIAAARNAAARREMIAALQSNDPALFAAFTADKRKVEGESHFIRVSQRYPLCGRGDINTYTVFAELDRFLLSGRGRVGMVCPSGIATDDTTKFFFQDLMQSQSLASMYDFENRQGLFVAVHRSYKFCLLTMTGADIRTRETEFVFLAWNIGDLDDKWRRSKLSAADFAMLNSNTATLATFRSRRDADTTKQIYGRVPVLMKETPTENRWGITFKQGLFNKTSDSDKFRARDDLEARGFTLEGNHYVRGAERYLPLYEAKMFDTYNHRFAEVVLSATALVRQGQARQFSGNELVDADVLPQPRYWVAGHDVETRLDFWDHAGLIGFRDVTSSTNERTSLFSILPRVAVGHTAPLVFAKEDIRTCVSYLSHCSSFVFDDCTRQKFGGIHLTYSYLKQLPVIPPHTYAPDLLGFITPRVLELTYTVWVLQPFARDLGYDGDPFVWNEERRFIMRRQLDALNFHLYGIERADV